VAVRAPSEIPIAKLPGILPFGVTVLEEVAVEENYRAAAGVIKTS
jgi:hypothetical protein